MRFVFGIFLVFVLAARGAFAGQAEPPAGRYAGSRVCAGCHKAVAATQAKTAMAETWHGSGASSFPNDFRSPKPEGSAAGSSYEVLRAGDHFEYGITLPDSSKVTLPVEEIVGGQRHGLSFLLRTGSIDGIALDRPVLVEGRYAYNAAHRALVLSPGFALDKPTTYEDAIGNVLSPTFETKCLTCHGEPNTMGAGKEGGVHCESCHGPALAHIAAVGRGNPGEGVVNPKRLTPAQQMAVCAQCHTGFTYQSDPMPDDLLVSNQVNALSHAECFIQTAGKLTCTRCHDPHADSPDVTKNTSATCLSCHSATVSSHASICPVNQTGECVGCHMPSIQKGSFHLTDHWIRVHPEQNAASAKHDPAWRSQVPPLREFLRLIVTPDQESAQAASKRLADGEPFSKVAHDVSSDPTGPGGGYLGDMELSQLDSKLGSAAARLWYGETSSVINLGNRYVILSRQPRDFKWEANLLFQQASELKARGDLKEAVEKNHQALTIYPYFLRAMIFMATTLAGTGDVAHASEILRFAAQSYPKDSTTQFNLGLTLSGQPAEQVAAFQRAIELDPDLVAVYESLGAAEYAMGHPQAAIETFRKGLLIDPLSAKLNYDLGLALNNQGDHAEAQRRMALAAKADPQTAPKGN